MLLNLKYKKIIKIIKNGGIGILPTDTLYGVVGDAFSEEVVNKIYQIKGRNEKKPFIVLISSLKDLKKFGIILTNIQVLILKKIWPGKISIILPCSGSNIKKLRYLHRGENSIAFRFPKKKKLIEILKKTGPLVAPSANPEGLEPAENILKAKKYFGDKVDFYLSSGTLKSKPSSLIKFNKNGEIEILRGIINKWKQKIKTK